jgi:hypothetical protein
LYIPHSCISIVRSLYFKIFSASFWTTFLSPGIATYYYYYFLSVKCPQNNFPYPETPVRVKTNRVHLLITSYANWQKEHKQSVSSAPEITPVMPIARQKYPPYLEGYLEIFIVFQNFYLQIIRFFAQPQIKSRYSVYGQHCISHCYRALHDSWLSGIF